MRYIALLRGVTPTGKNRIPSMAALSGFLTEAGFRRVRTYIQSGNIILETGLSPREAAEAIHRVILNNIGADLSVIMKTAGQLASAAEENPFTVGFDPDRVHLVFTNDEPDAEALRALTETEYEEERLAVGSKCIYMYLPRGARKKKLSTNYLERRLGITATMRKLGVVRRLGKLGE